MRFVFSDGLRTDAPEAVTGLKAQDLPVELLSGDREAPVAPRPMRSVLIGIRRG